MLIIKALIYGGPGPPATLIREPGQDRKVAATANDVCAGMWLGLPPNCLFPNRLFPEKINPLHFSWLYLFAQVLTSDTKMRY
ncbi:hypothetical protein VR7878_03321 [Vibrio ruber DSM 16370]|uniref:Uncharacterized protein n=1 Tax=Vibrio ruber (strain DSM 16370 / JCM 11486 / BCRC 17186 / CECT 7878 / LMG 23124 / VR1) TaxID=1123498 RepID=A0A1R4LS25_VIBR1|nr:hypothetical protein VR7878_03321 [Vibrio ruber DSM 16370]